MSIRITIGGCRDFNDYEFFKKAVTECVERIKRSEEIIILSGHCSGTDLMAERYALENGYKTEIYPAEWKKYGRGAGIWRNRIMTEKSDAVIAFWDGKSRGTKNLIETAKKLQKYLEVVEIQ